MERPDEDDLHGWRTRGGTFAPRYHLARRRIEPATRFLVLGYSCDWYLDVMLFDVSRLQQRDLQHAFGEERLHRLGIGFERQND
jgi:hypothetical protein